MGFWEFIVVIVFITTMGNVLTAAIKAQGKRPHPPRDAAGNGSRVRELAAEVHALRAEVERIRAGAAATGRHDAGLTRDAAARLDALSEEIHTLRDTTTQFDMTFDAALERLERRLERLEASQPPQQQGRVYTGADEEAAARQTVGQR